MWHLKTKMGTFWIVPTDDKKQYWLGVGQERLGLYKKTDDAVHDVNEQTTGFPMWDSQNRIKAPDDIEEWELGEPEEW